MQEEIVNDSIQDLLRSLKTTAGARFSAAKRVAHLDSRMTAVTALTSVLIIVMTIVPYMIDIRPQATSWINFYTVGLSILLLVVSLLHYSCQFGVRAELFHRSALEIQELKRELRFLGAKVDVEKFNEISRAYNEIMKRYALNHDDADFWRHQLEYPKDHPLTHWDRITRCVMVKWAYHYPTFLLAVLFLSSIALVVAALNWPVSVEWLDPSAAPSAASISPSSSS